MPELRHYHILISHSWQYDEQYRTVVSWLNLTRYFYWSNYSVSCDDPFDTRSDTGLENKLREQISHCSCILVLSGMYAYYSKWIRFEIECAKEFGKPIIAVMPWGQERTPQFIQENADHIVGWNRDSVIDAIRYYAIPRTC